MKKNPDYYSVTDLVEIGLFGREKAYALMRSPEFPSVRIGKKFLVNREAFWAWVNQQKTGGGVKVFDKVAINTSGHVNKDVVAAILARAITGGNAKEYLRKIAEDQGPKKK